jgi:hypothetical protein
MVLTVQAVNKYLLILSLSSQSKIYTDISSTRNTCPFGMPFLEGKRGEKYSFLELDKSGRIYFPSLGKIVLLEGNHCEK